MKSTTKHTVRKLEREQAAFRAQLPDPTMLLMARDLPLSEVARILQAYGLQDWKQADQNLQAMAGDPDTRKSLASILQRLLAGFALTADPDQALNEWERYVDSGIQRRQLFHYLAQAPHLLDVMGTVFGNSQAMAQTLIRDPLLIYWIEEDRVLYRRQMRATLIPLLQSMLKGVKKYEGRCEALRRFKRREMLRLGIRDLLGIATPRETYTGLSELAASVIQAAYELVDQDLQRQHGSWGAPATRRGKDRVGFAVVAMGKLGGWELNYSSDVDLIYIYQAPEKKTVAGRGQQALSGSEYFHALAQELTHVLSEATAEGALFRVDMRLRPEGQVGPLASSVDDAWQYYQTRGRMWERLAFLKARPLAGDLHIAQSLIRKLSKFVYGTRATATQIFPAIQDLRSEMVEKMRRRGELHRNVKLGRGGIREIEFIVQGLQLRWGYRYPSIRDRQTLAGLTKLFRIGKLKLKIVHELTESYLFLRDLEHKLQMVHELQTHLLPVQEHEVAKCAIRMGYLHEHLSDQTREDFLQAYHRHTERVHLHYQQIIEKS